MNAVGLDAQERRELCHLLDALGPDAPTLLDGWTTRHLAAHLVLREHDVLAAPCLVLPRPFSTFADRRAATLARRREFQWLVARFRTGPPRGFFRLRWVRNFPSLNEFFVHHEDVRRANGMDSRVLTTEFESALWRNACRSGRYLARRLRAVGLELERSDTGACMMIRSGEPVARLNAPPGELLLYLFGRATAAQVEITGLAGAVAEVRRTRFGM